MPTLPQPEQAATSVPVSVRQHISKQRDCGMMVRVLRAGSLPALQEVAKKLLPGKFLPLGSDRSRGMMLLQLQPCMTAAGKWLRLPGGSVVGTARRTREPGPGLVFYITKFHAEVLNLQVGKRFATLQSDKRGVLMLEVPCRQPAVRKKINSPT